jgi:predicted transcriptional regulator
MSENKLLRLSAEIVSAHVRYNSMPDEALSDFIRSIYVALSRVGAPEPLISVQEPAVPIKKSVFPDYIICLEDGLKLKMLKRHLRTAYGMTPDDYRARWKLPANYPMVAPNYATRRSVLAKENGLGRKPAEGPSVDVPVQHIPEGVRGMRKKPD